MLADDAHNLGIAQVSVLVGPGRLRAGWQKGPAQAV